MTSFTTLVSSPVGALRLVVDAHGQLVRLDFGGGTTRVVATDDAARCAHVAAQLAEYFAGHRRTFDLALAPEGTPFQLAVWEALRRIPYGTTTSYAELACAVGRPKAVRAVGAANGHNPIPIVVPCHRVIGADGSLTGFGGGLAAKRALLELEGLKVQAPAGAATARARVLPFAAAQRA
ncbi:MAG: methylated-DNA--[protein]-cysteine S-methyltransferase [Planctomycetota bacterium]